MQHEFSFEELVPHIGGDTVTGMMLYGKATLTSDEFSDDPMAFYVSKVTLEGGRPINQGDRDSFSSKIFDAVTRQIENENTSYGKSAAAEWAAAVNERVAA